MKQVNFILITALVALSSCSRYYYRPNGVNTPLFTDGGQAHFNIAGSYGNQVDNDNSGNTYLFDFQGAYSPIKYLGIMANYSTYAYRPDNPDVANGDVDADGRLLEFGVGGYYASKGTKIKLVADLYAGYGFGNLKSDVDMKTSRIFVQPGIGIRSNWFDASFNLRIVNLKFSDFNSKGRDDTYLMDKDLIDSRGRRIDQRNYVFAEPALTIRGGYKFAKVQFQMVLADEVTQVQWNYSPSRFTVGFYFTLEDALRMGQKK